MPIATISRQCSIANTKIAQKTNPEAGEHDNKRQCNVTAMEFNTFLDRQPH